MSAAAFALVLVAPGRLLLPQFQPDLLLDATAEHAVEFYHALTRPHLVIWTGFVVGWVVLEIAIVWNGVALFRRVRSVLNAA